MATVSQGITGSNRPPEALSVPPLAIHTHTLILLHGRGSNGLAFGPPIVSSRLSSGNTLAQEFPGMKFIFPTAKKRRAVRFNRALINQWFDLWSLDNPSAKQQLNYEGICETSNTLHSIIREEVRTIGLNNLFLGGLSQGCAIGLHILLNYLPGSLPGESFFGGFIGMSGWLPLAESLQEDVWPVANEEDDYDPFAKSAESSEGEEEEPQTSQTRAANFARDIINLPPLENNAAPPPFVKTPVFLGHGKQDEKVKIKLGEQARDILVKLGLDVTWKEYEEGHWYKVPDELNDIADFIRNRIADGGKVQE